MIGSIIHYFPSMTWDEVLWKRSYANITMLMATIPSYDTKKDENAEIETNQDFADFMNS